MSTITTDYVVGLPEDLSPDLNYTNPNRAPLYLNLKALNRVRTIKSTGISWVDYTTQGVRTSIKTAITAAETTIAVSDPSIFSVGCYARVGDEAVNITGINGNDLTVTRAQLGTIAEVAAIGDEIIYLNDNVAEGAPLQGASYKGGVNFENKTQIIREEISISGTAEAISMPSGANVSNYDLEKIKKMDTVVGRIEQAVVSGIKFENGNKRGMAGVKQFLNDGQVVDANGVEISLDIINQALNQIFTAGGNLADGTYAMYIPPVQKLKLDRQLEKKVNNTTNDSTLGAVVTVVATTFGELPLILSNNILPTETLIINHDELMLTEVEGRGLFHVFQGKDGDKTDGLIVAELSLEARGLVKQGKIVNLAK